MVDRMLGPNTLMQKQWINIHEIIEHVHALVKVEHEGVVFERDYDPSIPLMHVDSEQLIQALLNLVKNYLNVLKIVEYS